MKKNNLLVIIVLIFLIVGVLFILTFKNNKSIYYDSLDELDNKIIGISTGSTFDTIIKEKLPNAKIKFYDNVVDRIIALRNGKIDAFITDEALAMETIRNNQDLKIINEYIKEETYAYAISPAKSKLKKQIDEILLEFENDGTLKKMKEKWLGDDEERKQLEKVKLNGENGTITFGTLATSAPFAYLKDNKIVGYDIDILLLICEKLGYNLKISVLDWNGLLTAVSVNKVDIAGCSIIITEERKKSVLFSEPNYKGGVVAVTLKNEDNVSNSMFSNLKNNFYNTFIKEERYKLFIDGISITLTISLMSIIVGTALGIIIGIIRVSKKRVFKILTKLYIIIIQGIPITVLLLIMYYLILVKTNLSPLLVSIITFSIYLSAYVAEMIRGGYEAINYNQILSAYSLGFTKFQTIKYIITPQIISYMIPIYKGQIISTIKSTSVVGYIAITDLTKIGDMVRARTFDAFFSLISVSIIYLIICLIFEKILNILERNYLKKKEMLKC